ncbi:MAG: YtxH domain-containing protein [Deltaproteobacteria bacterium]|nr:YtxH domain-containing protein [Deltaproteobacteria bacterium]
MMNRRNDGRGWIGSLTSLAAQTPDFYRIANAVGRHRRRKRAERIARRAGWLGAGALIGAGVTALCTPETGAAIRRRISDQASRVRDYVRGPIVRGPISNGEDGAARSTRN